MISLSPLSRRTLLAAGGLGIAGAALGMGRADVDRDAFPVSQSEKAWLRQLGPERFRILRKAGTERPFSSPLNEEKRDGFYRCYGCNQRLFDAADKYDSRSGWPAFTKPIAKKALGYARDLSLGMVRTEEHCSRCGGHLGHVFDDGPAPLGKRHCINGLALRFVPA